MQAGALSSSRLGRALVQPVGSQALLPFCCLPRQLAALGSPAARAPMSAPQSRGCTLSGEGRGAATRAAKLRRRSPSSHGGIGRSRAPQPAPWGARSTCGSAARRRLRSQGLHDALPVQPRRHAPHAAPARILQHRRPAMQGTRGAGAAACACTHPRELQPLGHSDMGAFMPSPPRS